MLREGELDAMFSARAPSSFLRGEPHIARLFPDTREAEMAYYKKTGLFPIMHLVGIRKRCSRNIPGSRPASTRRSARPRRWR